MSLRIFLGCKPGKRLREYLHVKGAQKELTTKFAEVNGLRKGNSVVCNQEETYLKFTQNRRNVKVILFRSHNITSLGKEKILAGRNAMQILLPLGRFHWTLVK